MKLPLSPFRILLFLNLPVLVSSVAAAQALSAKAKDMLTAKYPGEQIVASCSAANLGKAANSFAALYSSADKRIRVTALDQNGGIRDVDTVPAVDGSSFELQCLSAREAKERKRTLRESEAIRDFLRVPGGRGAVCYFTTDTETKCWSTNKDGKLIDAGGWQT